MRGKTIRYISVGALFARLFLFFALLAPVRAYAAETRVSDQTNLFSAVEKQELEWQIATEREKMKLDLVIMTMSQAGDKSIEVHVDDFYDQGGYDYDVKKSGALHLIDMDNRCIHVSTAGSGIQFLSDSEIERLLDLGTPDVKSGNYAESVSRVLSDIRDSYRRAQRKGWAYDAKSGVWIKKRYPSPLAALGSPTAFLIAAFGVATGVKRNYKMQDGEARRASTVMSIIAASGAASDFGEFSDRLLDRNRVERRICRSNGGSGGGRSSGPYGSSFTHTNSGDSSHDGGGRSF